MARTHELAQADPLTTANDLVGDSILGGPPCGSGVPWEPAGQRARRVRAMLNGYTEGRKAALTELGETRTPGEITDSD
ncbi:hypothetical protein [Catenulispora subtropica]|uniref:Uncharacterized protein n=1 Tax=Catenulispora subtropica TaxID=450798 RepID=A0ABN2TBK5_9ACTN